MLAAPQRPLHPHAWGDTLPHTHDPQWSHINRDALSCLLQPEHGHVIFDPAGQPERSGKDQENQADETQRKREVAGRGLTCARSANERFSLPRPVGAATGRYTYRDAPSHRLPMGCGRVAIEAWAASRARA